MNEEDFTLFKQAEGLANTGQKFAAYQQFCALHRRGNHEIELLFWILFTTPYIVESRRLLDEIKNREPGHPTLPRAEAHHQQRMMQVQNYPIPGPVLLCPYCGVRAPAVRASKVSTGGWIIFTILLLCTIILCWIGLLIREEYNSCSYCGARLG